MGYMLANAYVRNRIKELFMEHNLVQDEEDFKDFVSSGGTASPIKDIIEVIAGGTTDNAGDIGQGIKDLIRQDCYYGWDIPLSDWVFLYMDFLFESLE